MPAFVPTARVCMYTHVIVPAEVKGPQATILAFHLLLDRVSLLLIALCVYLACLRTSGDFSPPPTPPCRSAGITDASYCTKHL